MKWVFWGTVGLVFYTYIGYAILLRLRAYFQSWPVQRCPQEPFLSIVLVVRNEEEVLAEKMRNMLELDYPRDRYQIVVVSDGSTDRTPEILQSFVKDPRVRVLLNQMHAGKASGINDATRVAQGEIVVFTDARQRIEPQALRALMEAFADPEVGCVSGELMLGNPESGQSGDGIGLYWRVEKAIRELETRSGSTVGATGALYAVRRGLVPQLPPESYWTTFIYPWKSFAAESGSSSNRAPVFGTFRSRAPSVSSGARFAP